MSLQSDRHFPVSMFALGAEGFSYPLDILTSVSGKTGHISRHYRYLNFWFLRSCGKKTELSVPFIRRWNPSVHGIIPASCSRLQIVAVEQQMVNTEFFRKLASWTDNIIQRMSIRVMFDIPVRARIRCAVFPQ